MRGSTVLPRLLTKFPVQLHGSMKPNTLGIEYSLSRIAMAFFLTVFVGMRGDLLSPL
jgi:hypothetical protein